jgi:hypothetical protein
MAKEKRQVRRAVTERFEQTYDARAWDYKKLIRPAQGTAKLIGIGVAFALYALVFGIAWLGWSSGRVSYELFFKTTWVLILPATAIGAFTWLFAFNRLENRVRLPLADMIARAEGEQGMLWRYMPVVQFADPKNAVAKAAFNASHELRGRAIDAEDYCTAVQAVRQAIARHEHTPIPTEVWNEVAQALDEV